MDLSKAELLKLYRNMVLARKVDEALMANSGKCASSLHPGIGQEAIGVGACTFLRRDDYLFHSHRGYAHLVAKGMPLTDLFAECFCRANSPTKGHGGTIHQAKPSIGVVGMSGTLGPQITMAAGLGIVCQHKGNRAVVLCFFGDGTSNRGTLHEGINMAAVWKLPVVYICENNQWSMCTNIKDAINVPDIAVYAQSYGIPGAVVDGNDVLAVYESVAAAVERAREGLGPSLIECKTYRIWGHTLADGGEYRDPAEVEAWKKRDPIEGFRARLLEMGILSRESIEDIDRDTEREVEEAVRYADESPFPDPADCTRELYAD